uniref:Photosystem I assembly protein Ycf19 n=1 Tax=Spumella sp. Baekdong012001B8 TaxID=2782410 RepID=A0A7S6PV92_9STRA|nr:photosystem I assembly protein Ycf19 [Spumella sp. Baekdong012001B8]
MAQNNKICAHNTQSASSSLDALIVTSFCTILYGLLQIFEVSIDCYRILCATTIIMKYLPYLRASKKPWSIFIALTKPYFSVLSKFLPTFYLASIGYDFSLLFSLEILRVLAKFLQEANFQLFFFIQKFVLRSTH